MWRRSIKQLHQSTRVPLVNRSLSSTKYHVPVIPKDKSSYLLREDGPATQQLKELFKRRLTRLHNTDFYSSYDTNIWVIYGVMGTGIGIGTSVLLSPILGVFLGSYFTVVGGFFSQVRNKFFGKPGDLSSPASELFENIVSFSLIVNAELSLEPWKGDLLDQYIPLRRSLTPYTSLQHLMVKEPITERGEIPRVVSPTSARIIWKNLMQEVTFHLEETNPWESEFSGWIGAYLKAQKPKLHTELVKRHFSIERQLDGRMQSFDIFYETFVSRSIEMLSKSCQDSANITKTNIFVLLSGIVFAVPLVFI